MLEPTDRVRLKLRRFTFSEPSIKPPIPCQAGPMGGHDASVPFGEHPARIDANGCLSGYGDLAPAHDDPRWPTRCEQCACELTFSTEWQVFQELIYRRADTGAEHTLRDAPPGAMYIADWFDGHLCVCLPPGGGLDYWDVDGPAKGGGSWTRSGEPPLVTARPSILTPRYHGFLTNGFLESC